MPAVAFWLLQDWALPEAAMLGVQLAGRSFSSSHHRAWSQILGRDIFRSPTSHLPTAWSISPLVFLSAFMEAEAQSM